jgi:hypothetical protein
MNYTTEQENFKYAWFLTVILPKLNKKGCAAIVKHIDSFRARNKVVETELLDTDHRVLKRGFYGTAFQGLSAELLDHKFISKIIDGAYKGGRRSSYKHRHTVLSMRDILDPDEYAKAQPYLENAGMQYIEAYYKHSPAVYWGIHGDKNNLHMHIIGTNWDEKNQRLLDYTWKRGKVIEMNSLRWYKGVIQPGAALYIREKCEVRPDCRPDAKTAFNHFYEVIKQSPKEKIMELERLQLAKRMRTTGGRMCWMYKGRRVRLDQINYLLRENRGAILNDDLELVEMPLKMRTELQRQHYYDKQIVSSENNTATLEEYEQYQDVPAFKLTPRQSYDIIHGVMPWDKGFRRQMRTAIFKRSRFGSFGTGLDPALKPVLGIIEGIIGGSTKVKSMPPRGSVAAFICVICAWMAGVPFASCAHLLSNPAMEGFDNVL